MSILRSTPSEPDRTDVGAYVVLDVTSARLGHPEPITVMNTHDELSLAAEHADGLADDLIRAAATARDAYDG